MSSCQHREFSSFVEVARIVDEADEPDVAEPIAFSADVKISCDECGERFLFIGFPVGSSPRSPTTSLDGSEARLPLRPESAPVEFGQQGPGYMLRVFDERHEQN